MEIVSRRAWGARDPKKPHHKIVRFQNRLILHHAAGAVMPGDDRVSDSDLRRVRGIQNYHMDSRGWNDIAYSYLLDPDGFAFEGRGAAAANGATKGYGSASYAICVMGNYDTQKPEDDLVQGVVDLVRWGHSEGLWPLAISGGHRDYGSTSCPGRHLYPLVSTVNETLAAVPIEEVPMLPITANSHRETIRYVQERLGVKLTGEWDEPTVDAVKALAVRSGTNDGKGLKGEWINGRMYSALDDEGAFAQAEKALKVAKVAGGASAAVVIAEIVQRLAG